MQRLVAIRNHIDELKAEAIQLSKDVSREELRLLVNDDRWEPIGTLFGFEPKYCEFQGRKTFNWQSCNAAFWKVFKPPVVGELSESRIYLKAMGENEAARKPPRKPKLLPRGTKPNPPRARIKVVHELQVVMPNTAPAGIRTSPNPRRRRHERRRIYEPEDVEFVNRLVWLKTRGRCFYCKCHVTAKLFISSMVKDHFIPLIADGPDDHSNLVPSCRPCDKAKGGKLPIGLPKEIIAKYVGHRNQALSSEPSRPCLALNEGAFK